MKRIWAAGLLVLFGCKGNINDDSVATFLLQIASLNTGGQAANNGARNADINHDGNVIVFQSNSSNLDSRDTNTISDIYVRYVDEGRTELVTVNTAGTGSGNNFSEEPRVSPDGRFVVFNSQSTNLTAVTDTNGNGSDVFCRDLWNGITVPVSLNFARTATHNFSTFDSADVTSDATNVYVAYVQSTSAGNEIVGTVTGTQVYVRRIPLATFTTLATHDVILVSDDAAAGVAGGNGSSREPVIGQDETGPNVYVAWQSGATNLVVATDGDGTTDIYWRPVVKATGASTGNVLVSINDALSSGGTTGVLPVVFVASERPAISDDGAWVAFQSDAVDLLPPSSDSNGAQDIFVRGDLILGGAVTFRASITGAGNETTSDSEVCSISDGGVFVVFESSDPNIVPGDTNGFDDIFRADTTTGAVERVSITLFGGEPNAACENAAVSGNGASVVFESSSSNIIPGVVFEEHVFLRRF